MSFDQVKKQVESNFKKLVTAAEGLTKGVLHYVAIDRDEIFNQYLAGFPEETRQEHNCNSCKSFLRQFGGIVLIDKEYKLVSLFDGVDVEGYEGAMSNLARYVRSLPVTDVLMNDVAECGTDKNVSKKDGTLWRHFFITLPSKFLQAKDSLDSLRANKRGDFDVFERGLRELKIDATETVLDIIAQNSLYRGQESKGVLDEFMKLQKQYADVPSGLRRNFAWAKAATVSGSISRIRNNAIGTLLIDLSEGTDLETAVNKFERQVMAPTNYKRPSALVSPKMVEDAKRTLAEAGLIESLERRQAVETDIDITNLLYSFTPTSLGDIFDEISAGVPVNPRTLNKVEEIGIEDFITNILPKAKGVEILIENSHMSNFVTLITAKNPEAPGLFKWDNPFSLNYTGGLADSMKERVKAAGGNVDGDFNFRIQWNEDGTSICDLDAHAFEPNGTHIYYSSNYRKDRGGKRTSMGGQLDVDMMSPRTTGVENITWLNRNQLGEGKFKLRVHNYNGGRNDGVRCEVECDGQIHEFAYNKNLSGTIDIAEVMFSRSKGFEVRGLIEGGSTVSSKQKWGINTNQFVRVNKIMLSPNHWNGTTGNKHFLFFVEGCQSDETARPFLNEFLHEDLDKHRKVLEILGSKVKVEESTGQLSGVGFSETQRNHLYAKVSGTFTRTLKINF